jgi:hypothetical protein
MEVTVYDDGKGKGFFAPGKPGTYKATVLPAGPRPQPTPPGESPEAWAERVANQSAMDSLCTLFLWALVGLPLVALILCNAREAVVNTAVGVGAVAYSAFFLCFVVPPVGIAVVVILAALAFGSCCCCCCGKR